MYPHTSPSNVSGGHFPTMLILGLAKWLALAAASVADSNPKPSEDLHALLANLGAPDSQQERSMSQENGRHVEHTWTTPEAEAEPHPTHRCKSKTYTLTLLHLLIFPMAVTDDTTSN